MAALSKCLVTGASGFVGANLLSRLLAEGHECHVLLRPSHDPWRLSRVKGDWRRHDVDLTDADNLRSTVKAICPELIFHLAAHGAYSWQTDVNAIIQTNLTSLTNLLDACEQVGFQAFVNAGSSSEYGYKDHPPAENELVEPNSPYAVAKAAATNYCRYLARNKQLQIATLRLYSAYGPFEDSRRLIPTLVKFGLAGELPPLVDATTARDYIYVDDVVDAFLLTAKKLSAGSIDELGAAYNIGTGRQTTMLEVVEVVRRVLNIDAAPVWGSMPGRRWDTDVWVANVEKAKHDLGFVAKHSFEEGLQSTISWTKLQ